MGGVVWYRKVPGSSKWKKNRKYDYEMCSVKLKSVQCAKDLGGKIASNLKYSQKAMTQRIKRSTVGFIIRNFSLKNKDVTVPLHNSLLRSHLEYAAQFSSP